MKGLETKTFEIITHWVRSNARDVDRALFEYQFFDGSANGVFTALSHYHNIDGGFGKGLEPDFSTDHSTPIATTVAFQYFNKLNLRATFENELVRSGIGYLSGHYDNDLEGWAFTLKHVNDAPHAPWWEYYKGRDDVGFKPNPTAEIVGYLHQYSRFLSNDFIHLDELTERLVKLVNSEEEIEFHALLCFSRMYECVDVTIQEQIKDALIKRIVAMTETNPEKWSGYGATPLTFITSKDSLGYEQLQEAVDINLDYLLDEMNQDGYWEPTWNWETDKDHWEQAKHVWCGYLTVKNCKILKDFGRLKL